MDVAGSALLRAPDPAGAGAPLSVTVVDEQLRPPGWAEADPAWSPLVLGWESARGDRVGRALVLRRHVPGSGRFLALLPELPRLGGLEREPALWRPQAVALLRRLGAFAVRFGLPGPAQVLPRGGPARLR